MGKLIYQAMISLDGYFEGPEKQLNWHAWDGEMDDFVIELLNETSVLLFGRATYEMMSAYWPYACAPKDNEVVIERMNNLPKVVFSRALSNVRWNNTTLVSENAVEQIRLLKNTYEKNLVVYGSSNFGVTLIKHSLIDEYQLIVNPRILGKGNSLFSGLPEKVTLKLKNTRCFKVGNVLNYYANG